MAELTATIIRIRLALVEEATPQPGQSLAYGRPHAHPRARFFPRYSRTGERLAGAVKVRPDCPRPLKGRCECPPDGSWRPSVGVVRADATARYAVQVPAERLRAALEGAIWVDDVYELGPDGLWRCRRPMRRALERLRGASPARWATAVRLLRGSALATVWGAHGVPPNPRLLAGQLLGTLEQWAQIERETEWERRPRQWWDRPRGSTARSIERSESQANADFAARTNGEEAHLTPAATLSPTTQVVGREPPGNRIGRGAHSPSGTPGELHPRATAFHLDTREEAVCA